MTEKELKKYIRKKLMRGYPAGELESELLAKGIPQEQIKAVMNNPTNSWTSNSTMKNIMIVNIICVLFFIGLKVILNPNFMVLAIIFLIMVIALPLISLRISKRG